MLVGSTSQIIAGENINFRYPTGLNHYVHIVRIKSCFLICHIYLWYVSSRQSRIIMLLLLLLYILYKWFVWWIQFGFSLWSLIINVLIIFLLAQVRMSYESFINIQLNTHKNLTSHSRHYRYWHVSVKKQIIYSLQIPTPPPPSQATWIGKFSWEWKIKQNLTFGQCLCWWILWQMWNHWHVTCVL